MIRRPPRSTRKESSAASDVYKRQILMSTNFSACLNNSPAITATVVVPSPTASSWDLEMSMRIFAAGLFTWMDLRIVAPSLVIVIFELCSPTECNILS
eukprot:TRINITY_DN9620_c0_g1_i2.p2 TRINITY_DN9620_c0_g1~~TRINITY_DN9620_c0_g1_i2.p2  ORF type:complete len:106 (+),score=32.37 TRINITY_DN9620_c0_g1_i2:25-318(+)